MGHANANISCSIMWAPQIITSTPSGHTSKFTSFTQKSLRNFPPAWTTE